MLLFCVFSISCCSKRSYVLYWSIRQNVKICKILLVVSRSRIIKNRQVHALILMALLRKSQENFAYVIQSASLATWNATWKLLCRQKLKIRKLFGIFIPFPYGFTIILYTSHRISPPEKTTETNIRDTYLERKKQSPRVRFQRYQNRAQSSHLLTIQTIV